MDKKIQILEKIDKPFGWKKTDGANKSSKPPTLKSLPPTNEALEMNIKRAHCKLCCSHVEQCSI